MLESMWSIGDQKYLIFFKLTLWLSNMHLNIAD